MGDVVLRDAHRVVNAVRPAQVGAVSSAVLTPSPGDAGEGSAGFGRSVRRPVRSQPAGGEPRYPPSSPPVKRYAGISHFHTGSLRTGRPWIAAEFRVGDDGTLRAAAHRCPGDRGGRRARANAAAAAPAPSFHISGRFRVVTTGSGGRPYTSGSSRNRKNAPIPSTPSSGSGAVEPCVGAAARVRASSTRATRTRAELVEGAEQDRRGRAGLRARGHKDHREPVVAERAFPARPSLARGGRRWSMTPNGHAGTQ